MERSIEVWKDIEGYEGLYQVSNWGKVRSLDREINHGGGNISKIKGKIKKAYKDKKDYLQIKLNKNGFGKSYLVHRLVGIAFLPNPNNLPQINHKSERKDENFVWINEDGTVDFEKSNLEWCDNWYNSHFGSHIKRVAKSNLNNPKRSRKIGQYTLDGKLVAIYPSIREASRVLKIDSGFITMCCQGKRKSCHGFIFKYL